MSTSCGFLSLHWAAFCDPNDGRSVRVGAQIIIDFTPNLEVMMSALAAG
jgi:hypothetical protein